MASTRQQVGHYTKHGGMSRGVRPHLLEEDKWFTDLNMRPFRGTLKQVPLKRVRQYTVPYSGRTMLELCNVPTPNGSILIGLTEDRVKRIYTGNATMLKENGVEVELTRSTTYERFGKTTFNNNLFFVNQHNAVKYTDGVSVKSVGGTCPRGRFVEVWFDHIVVGGPLFGNGEDLYDGIAWSHLNEWSNFTPDTHSEADRYVFTEFQRDFDLVPGVTGLRRMGNACIVYTASSIYQMRYVGLPRVIRVDPVVHDFGNGFKHSIASTNGRQYFIDGIAKTFFSFNGVGVEDVGAPIAQFFFDTLTRDPELQQRTWAYVDFEFGEIWWVYVSRDSGREFDLAVVYSFIEKKWWVASVEDVHCFATSVTEGVVTCDELPGTCDSLNGTCDQLGGESGLPLRLWGGRNERLLQEEAPSNETTELLYQRTPVLETGDSVFGSIQHEKEMDPVAVQSALPRSVGLEVWLSNRANLDDPVEFDKVGMWNPVKGPVVAMEKVSERVFRWRFGPPGRLPVEELVFKNGMPNFTLRTEMLGPTLVPPVVPGDSPPPPLPATTHGLHIRSTNPGSGIAITVVPADINGVSNGTTPFDRLFDHNRAVTLTAPPTDFSKTFSKWQKAVAPSPSSVDVGVLRTIEVVVDNDITMTAVYADSLAPPPTSIPPFGPPPDRVGYYVDLRYVNPNSVCGYIINTSSVINATVLDGEAVIFEKEFTGIGTIAPLGATRFARVYVNVAFTDLLETGPDMQNTAASVEVQIWGAVDGVCGLQSTQVRTLSYSSILGAIKGQASEHDGSSGDPFIVDISNS